MNEKLLIETGEFIRRSLLNGSSKTNPAFDEVMLSYVCNSLTLLKEQESLLEEYHKADGFLTIHGWWSKGRR